MTEHPRWVQRDSDFSNLQILWVSGVMSLFVIAEILILLRLGLSGLFVHVIAAAVILVGIQLMDGPLQLLFQSLILLPVLRLFNLGLPQFTDNDLIFFAVIYEFLLLSTWLIMRSQSLTFEDLGLTRRNLVSVFPGTVIGVLFGAVQYNLSLEELRFEPTVTNYLLVIIVAGILVGFVEEVIFRGLIQRRLSELVDTRLSIVVVSVLFGFMHGVWLAPLNIAFALTVSLILGYLYARYRDLVLVISIHASINATAFVLLPVYFL